MSQFTVDARRWADAVVPRVLAGDWTAPRAEERAPMRALVAILGTLVDEGAIVAPAGRSLHAIAVDDQADGDRLLLELRCSDPIEEAPISTAWSDWFPLLPLPEELAGMEALGLDARGAREAELLRQTVDAIVALANDMLECRLQQRVGRVVLAQVPEGMSDEQMRGLVQAFRDSTLGQLLRDCLEVYEERSRRCAGADRYLASATCEV